MLPFAPIFIQIGPSVTEIMQKVCLAISNYIQAYMHTVMTEKDCTQGLAYTVHQHPVCSAHNLCNALIALAYTDKCIKYLTSQSGHTQSTQTLTHKHLELLNRMFGESTLCFQSSYTSYHNFASN